MPLLSIVLAVAALVLGAAGPANAYVLEGTAWPKAVVTYSSLPGLSPKAVDRGARAWNRAQVGVRFRRAPSALADVTVRPTRGRCGGRALVGYASWTRSWVEVAGHCRPQLATLMVVHELGHVLGLGHEEGRCAVMNSWRRANGTPSHCRRRPIEFWLKRPLSRDDLWGARLLYAAE